MLYTDFIFTLVEEYSRTSTNGHLTTKAIFFVDSQYIDSCFNLYNGQHFLLSLMWPLS